MGPFPPLCGGRKGWGEEVMIINMITRARNLRKRMTDAEIKLWQALRLKQIMGIRFRRQVPLGKYIVDFVSHEIKLIIELDGGQHNEKAQIEYDTERTKWLETQGYRIQRFWNNEVLLHFDTVLDKIWYICNPKAPHPFLPPHNGGKGPTAADIV